MHARPCVDNPPIGAILRAPCSPGRDAAGAARLWAKHSVKHRLTYTSGPFPQAKRSGVLFKSLAGNLCGDSRLKAFGEKTE